MTEMVKQTSSSRVQSPERIDSRNQTGVPESRIFNFCVNLVNYLSYKLFYLHLVVNSTIFKITSIYVFLQKKLMCMPKELTRGLQCNRGWGAGGEGEISTAWSWMKYFFWHVIRCTEIVLEKVVLLFSWKVQIELNTWYHADPLILFDWLLKS
jgi:hypothetical protein